MYTSLFVILGNFVGTIGVVVNPQAAGFVVFAMGSNDLATESVFDGRAVVAVVAIPFNPVILVNIKLHGVYPLIGDSLKSVCVAPAFSVTGAILTATLLGTSLLLV